MTAQESIRAGYSQRIDECKRELCARRRLDYWLGHLRVAMFLPAIALAYYGLFQAASRGPWLVAAAALVVGFIVVVRVHERTLRAAVEAGHRLQVSEIQLARMDRCWELVPACEVVLPPQGKPVADDLDLFGHASLYQLISQAYTPFGREALRDWLLSPASPAEIADRQLAVDFLAPATDTREEICLRGRMLGANERSTVAFVDWAEGAAVLLARPWLCWLTRASTAVIVLAVVGALAGLISATAGFLAIAATACLHLVILAIYGGRIHDTLDRVTSRSHDIDQYRPLLETIAALPAEIPWIAKLHSHMGATPREPLQLLAGLTRLVRIANLRRDGLFGVPYYISQFLLLADFHVVGLMEHWQRRHGAMVRRWLEGVGRVEAISSLATLAHDNPKWTLPVVDERCATTIVGRQFGHPLLADDERVANDVEIGPAGTFVLVTGSNMSGKSTLLRAVGINLVLAQAGAPVCASELWMPPVVLETSIRARDSLADGVSFFMAELRRLKEIVDRSRECRQSKQQLVYLLDEILQGTNSAERHIAVGCVIGHLLEHGAIGMVSTHDLELARSPNLESACRTVHFRETITGIDGDERMSFDYLLRPGLASTTNALKLLKFVGLGD